MFSVQHSRPIEMSFQVGRVYKDLPEEATQMKKDYEEAAQKARALHETAMTQFRKDKASAEERAHPIKAEIAKLSGKLLAMENDLISLMTVTGVLIAAAFIALPPLFFVAIPFACAAGVVGYFMIAARIKRDELQEELQIAPNIPEPQLKLPPYDVSRNLDVKESRQNAQKSLAGGSLEQIATSPWSSEQIAQYALLDRAAPRIALLDETEQARPQFYAKVIQLVDSYRSIQQQNGEEVQQAQEAYKTREAEIDDNEGRWAYMLRHTTNDLNRVLYSSSAANEIYRSCIRKNEEQLEERLKAIDDQFNSAKQELEQQFIAAKQAAHSFSPPEA